MRPHKEPKRENKERWLLTYSDMITLLMIFFIVMYAISNVNAQKFAALAHSLAQVLSGESHGIGESPGPSFIPGVSEETRLRETENELEKIIAAENLADYVQVVQEDRGLVLRIKDTILFPRGSADLTPEAQKLLTRVAQILGRMPNYIRVEGHTDDLPIHTERFPSNWELSVLRATTVVHVLVEKGGIDPRYISATGFGEYRPEAPNTSEANRSRNRRVEIVVLKQNFSGVEPAPGT